MARFWSFSVDLSNIITNFSLGDSLILLVTIWSLCLYISSRRPSNFPPGPRPWPIIGNLDIFIKDPQNIHRMMIELSLKYGPVIGLKLGKYPAIVLNGLDAIKEALVKNGASFSARPHFMHMIKQVATVDGRIRGPVWQSGEEWRQTRRFTLSLMRDFGVATNSIETKVLEETDAMCDELEKHKNKPYDVTMLLQRAINNVICSVCFGSRFEYSDKQFSNLMQKLNYVFQCPIATTPVNFIPILRFLPSQHWVTELNKIKNELHLMIKEQIDKHRSSFDPNNLRDAVDVFLSKEKDTTPDEYGTYSPSNMILIIRTLFNAGTETSSTVMRWFFLYMLHFPDVQKRCQDEIDSVVGQGRKPALLDRPNLPFTEATIQETLRLSSVVPLSIPHATDSQVSLYGYTIPKDTIVLVNLYSANMDTKYWDKPEAFLPERWLGRDGKIEKHEASVTFSVGPRTCLGDTMAKNELFLFITVLLQRFTFHLPNSQKPPSMTGHLGMTLAPEQFHVVANSR